jgi:hypothetical protein
MSMPTRSSSLAKSQYRRNHTDRESRDRDGGRLSAIQNDAAERVASSPGAVAIRGGPLIPASLLRDMIRDAAYFRAVARGFIPGKEVEDWLAAEQQIQELIRHRYGG